VNQRQKFPSRCAPGTFTGKLQALERAAA